MQITLTSQKSSKTQVRISKLVFITWFLTLDLIMFGAFVRLTDSGLGCPDWPGCYGSVTPVGAMQEIKEAASAMPDGPVTIPKAWIEMIHRYVGAGLGVLIIAITFMAWRHRKMLGQSPALASSILVLVCLQGAFGAWTVTHKLMPVVVTGHLLLGMSLLASITWLAARFKVHQVVSDRAKSYLPWLSVGLVLLFCQIALGGWVSTNYAALACMDFPTCQGQWWPQMDARSGFSLLRALGQLPSGEIISQHALTAIHWVHRNVAFIVFAYIGVLAVKLRRFEGLRGPATLVLILLAAQLLSGLTTIFFQWPIAIAVMHNGGAAGLVIAVVTLLVRLGTIRKSS
jgi:cytochrome c oxidase assembly protein subunit 15